MTRKFTKYLVSIQMVLKLRKVYTYIYIHIFDGGLVAKLCLTLATPWTVACQAPLSMRILQARILEWVAISFCRESSRLRDGTQVSCIAGRLFTD